MVTEHSPRLLGDPRVAVRVDMYDAGVVVAGWKDDANSSKQHPTMAAVMAVADLRTDGIVHAMPWQDLCMC